MFNEEVVSQFDDSYIIEAYLENFDGFQGGGDLLTKFGIRQTDEITMVISQQRFSDLISQFLLLDRGHRGRRETTRRRFNILPTILKLF